MNDLDSSWYMRVQRSQFEAYLSRSSKRILAIIADVAETTPPLYPYIYYVTGLLVNAHSSNKIIAVSKTSALMQTTQAIKRYISDKVYFVKVDNSQVLAGRSSSERDSKC